MDDLINKSLDLDYTLLTNLALSKSLADLHKTNIDPKSNDFPSKVISFISEAKKNLLVLQNLLDIVDEERRHFRTLLIKITKEKLQLDKFLQAEQGNFIPHKILLQEEMKIVAMEFKNKQVLNLQSHIQRLEKLNTHNRNVLNFKKTQEYYLSAIYDFKESLNLSYISNSQKQNVNNSIYKERRVSITSNSPTVACDSINSNKNQCNSLVQEIYDTSKITCKNTTRTEHVSNIDKRLLDNSFHSGNDFYLSRSIISNMANSECNRNWAFRDLDEENSIRNESTPDNQIDTAEKTIRVKKETEIKKKKKAANKKLSCKIPTASSTQNKKPPLVGNTSSSLNGNFQSTPFSINSSNVRRKVPKSKDNVVST